MSLREETDLNAPNLSTMADCIVQLDYEAGRGQECRRTRVIKMRGSNHDERQREIDISPAGLEVNSTDQ